MTRKIPDWIWTIAAPLLFVALTLFLEHFTTICVSACEDGPVEDGQALIMFMAFGLGLRLLYLPRGTYPQWARVFFTLGVVASLYIALEEISYGQRIFGWVTPQAWDVVNDQQETNLHNTSSWLDQKPRLLLELGVIIGGLIIPALRRWGPRLLPGKFAVVYPANGLWLTALIELVIHLYDKGTAAIGREDWFVFDRGSEMQETYLFWFVLFYFIFKYRELKDSAAPAR
jgi:hypothetical protein